MAPGLRDKLLQSVVACVLVALAAAALSACAGCIGIVEFGDPGAGTPVSFPQEATQP